MKQCLRSRNDRSAAVDQVNRTLVEVRADGGDQGAVNPYKAAIKVGETQEALQLHPGRRLRPIHHHFHLLRIHLDPPIRNNVAQKGNSGVIELTFFRLNEQLFLQKALVNLPDMEHVLLGGAGEGKDVINVDEDKPVRHVTENVRHPSLEHGRGVGETKGHDQISIVATLKAVFPCPPA